MNAGGIVSYPLARDQDERGERFRLPFIYEAFSGETALTSGVDIPFLVDIDTDAPFLWLYIMGAARDTSQPASLTVIENFNATITIRIGGPGSRAIMNSPVPWVSLCPFRPQYKQLPAAKVLAPGSQLHVTITPQFTDAALHEIAVQAIGVKLFGRPVR